MKKQNNKSKITPDQRVLIGIVLIMPVTIIGWREYLFPNISDTAYIVLFTAVIISLILGIYNIWKSNEERKPKADAPGKTKKIIRDGRIVEVDEKGKVINSEEKKEEKEEVPLCYIIPQEIMIYTIFFIWAIVGGYIAEYSETSWLLRFFPTKNFLMGMLLAVDTIFCIALWFLYMGYFHYKNKRKLFLVLIVLIYVCFYLYMKQY